MPDSLQQQDRSVRRARLALWRSRVPVIVSFFLIGLVLVASLFFLRLQTFEQAIQTITLLSLVMGMIISTVTVTVNFFQWRTAEKQLSVSLPPPTPATLPTPASATVGLTETPAPVDSSSQSLLTGRKVSNANVVAPPAVEQFLGREQEMARVYQWVGQDRYRVVAILGLGGVGKTTFASSLVARVAPDFEHVFWCKIQHPQSLTSVLEQWLFTLSQHEQMVLPTDLEARLSLLHDYIARQRCLFILDNFESLLQEGHNTGAYREGFQEYGRLLALFAERAHQSCLLITSREMPREIVRLQNSQVGALYLPGMALEDAQQLLQAYALQASPEIWQRFVRLYSGNPLALKLVAFTIQELFVGDVAAFLEQREWLVGDVQELLEGHFLRLSPLERDSLYWLAIAREAVSLSTLQADMLRPLTHGELLQALLSLRQRSLVESSGPGSFSVQPVILEYVTTRLVLGFVAALSGGQGELWRSHALMQAQAPEYIRAGQRRFLLTPVSTALRSTLGQDEVERSLQNMLSGLRGEAGLHAGYGASNILHILHHLDVNLQGYDFSRLQLKQAYLQDMLLHNVNFASAQFERCVFTENFGNILAVRLSHDRRLLAAGTANGCVEIWSLPGAVPFMTLTGHIDWVRTIVFSLDGSRLVSGSDDGSVKIWNLRNVQCLRTIATGQGKLYSVAFHPSGSLIASGGDKRGIALWDANTGQRVQTLSGHTGRVRALTFSPDGSWLASAAEDTHIRIWDVATGVCLHVLSSHEDRVYSVAFHPDGTQLVSASDDQSLRVWTLVTQHNRLVLQGHKGRVQAVDWSPDGLLLASVGEDQTVRIWDARTGDLLQGFQEHHNRLRAVAWSADSTMVASGGDDQSVRLWDIKSASCLRTIRGHSSRVYALAFHPSGSLLISDSDDLALHVWDLASGQHRETWHGHRSWIYSIACSPDGRLLASASDDQTVRIWRLADGRCLQVLRGHKGRVRAVVFATDSKTVISGSDDQTIRVWDVESAECQAVLSGQLDRVRALSIQQSLLLSGGDDEQLCLYNLTTGQLLATLAGHRGRVWSVAFHPTQPIFASGGEDQAICLWQQSTGERFASLPGHSATVYALAFSHDGRFLVSGSEDHTVRVWDVATLECVRVYREHSSRIRAVAFHPEQYICASGSHDGLVKLWHVDSSSSLQTLRHDRPYESMNITHAKGITHAQRAMLKTLGALDDL